MSVYVDSPRNWGSRFNGSCHMWADSLFELHEMARLLGLKREWFQKRPNFPHYDLSPGKRAQALRLGAREFSIMEWKKA